jgi:hypothetical protein
VAGLRFVCTGGDHVAHSRSSHRKDPDYLRQTATRKKKFKAELQSGHQEDAVEVPFDPATTWDVAPVRLWRGRRGHAVLATLNGISFETFIVSRQQRFFMLVEGDIKEQAGVAVGEIVTVTVAPVVGVKV